MKRIRKNISVEVDDTFDVDVTLSLEEICEFFEKCDNEEKLTIRRFLKLNDVELQGKTLMDTLKLELVQEALKKYTLDELERRLK